MRSFRWPDLERRRLVVASTRGTATAARYAAALLRHRLLELQRNGIMAIT